MSDYVGEKQAIKAARKRHRCYWCGQIIDIGHPYTKWVSVNDGSAATVKVHPECADAWDAEALAEGGYLEVGQGEGERPIKEQS